MAILHSAHVSCGQKGGKMFDVSVKVVISQECWLVMAVRVNVFLTAARFHCRGVCHIIFYGWNLGLRSNGHGLVLGNKERVCWCVPSQQCNIVARVSIIFAFMSGIWVIS